MTHQIEWIPCGSQTPDNRRTVLVTVESMGKDGLSPDMVTIGRYLENHWQIATVSETREIYSDATAIVTAWSEMPIPYHIKEGDETDIWRMIHNTP